MKTPRERIMAYLALVLITLTLFGLLYFLYYDRNMSTLRNRQRTAQAELDRDEATLAEVQKALPGLMLAKRLSLPADVGLARRQYGLELEKMLASAEFPRNKVQVTPKQMEAPKALIGAAARQKPPFSRVTFDIQAHGDLTMLVDFLERFYRTPLLHRVKSMTVSRPLTRTAEQMPGELDINLTIEALILDGAENRKTLLPTLKEEEKPKVLARSTSQYAAIAGNNVFFGAPARDTGGGGPRADYNILPEIVLDEITHDERGSTATLFDAANEYRYVIKKRYDGSYRVSRYYFLKDAPRPTLDIGEEKLQLKDAKDFVHRTFKVARIDAADLLLEDAGTFYRMHMGMRMSEIEKLTSDEARKLGLVRDEKKDDKAAAKVENKKDGKDTEVRSSRKPDEGR